MFFTARQDCGETTILVHGAFGHGSSEQWALTLGVVASKTFQEFKRDGIWSTAHQPVAERPWWVKSSCCSAFFACGNGRFLCYPTTLGLTGQANLSSQQHELKTFVPLAWHSLNVLQSFSMSICMSEYLVEDLECRDLTYQPRWVWSRKRQHFCRAFVNPQAYRMGSSRYSRLKPGVLHFLEAPESSRVISVEAPVIAKIPKKTEKYLIQLLCGIELSVLFLWYWYTSTQLLFASNHRLSPRTPRNNCNKQAEPALTLPPSDMSVKERQHQWGQCD